MDRNEIDVRLHKLRADLPSMLADAKDPEDFWPAFVDEASTIEGSAVGREDCRYVRAQLSRMLRQAGVPERPERATPVLASASQSLQTGTTRE